MLLLKSNPELKRNFLSSYSFDLFHQACKQNVSGSVIVL